MAILALRGIFQVIKILSLFYLYNSNLGFKKSYFQVYEFNSAWLLTFHNFYSWRGERKEVIISYNRTQIKQFIKTLKHFERPGMAIE